MLGNLGKGGVLPREDRGMLSLFAPTVSPTRRSRRLASGGTSCRLVASASTLRWALLP